MTFANKFNHKWQELYNKNKFEEPSVIQKESYDVIANGENVLLLAPTGSGKTLAYLWPTIEHLKQGVRNQVVIVVPSQELAMQVVKVAKEWAKPLDLKVQQLIGGANINRQIDKLKKHPEIIVGTPGRIVELMNRKKVRADYVETLIFDEVDLLLADKSEWNFAQKILQKVQRDVQVIAVSATFSDETIYQLLPSNLQVIDVRASDDSKGEVVESYLRTPLRKRVELLKKCSFVEDMHAIVFFNTVEELGNAAAKLQYEGVPISTLASDQNKFERQISLAAFKEKQSTFLLTTDIASRGLDLEGLETVIHYDIPQNHDTYLHRIGRVGRMGQDGFSIAFVNDRELRNLKEVVNNKDDLVELILKDTKLYLNN